MSGFFEIGDWVCSLTSEHANAKKNKMSSAVKIFRLNFLSTVTSLLEYFQIVLVVDVKVEEIVKDFYSLINTLLTQYINER
jgi:hypothetical protein